jgi:hypothetical protein
VSAAIWAGVATAGGWSVVVSGVAADVRAEERDRLMAALPWVGGWGEPPCLFRLPSISVSGRSIPKTPMTVGGLTLAGTGAGTPAAQGDRPPFGVTGGEPIDAQECRLLLAAKDVGRLAMVVSGRPLVFPVNYALDGETIVFRTAVGTKLHAISRSLVSFEVDGWSPPSQSPWYVVVEGLAQEITSADSPSLRERLARLPVYPLAAGDRHHYVRITPAMVCGRRFPSRTGPGGPG